MAKIASRSNKLANMAELARRNQEMMDRRMGRTPAGWCGKASGLPTDTPMNFKPSRYFEIGKREKGNTDRIMELMNSKARRDSHNRNIGR